MPTAFSEEKHRRVLNVLELVLELDPAVRGAYLESIGRQNPALRQQVAALLRTLNADPAAADEATAAEARLASQEMPARVGPYQVVREIGRGGMSRVYLAERADEEFERQVALKVIDQGLEAPIVHQRFLAERQILASFDSPLIAKLFDGGTLPNGRPYLVMELVEGVRVDQYVFEAKLGLRERIALFRKICQAVSYAHQKLVVHRDLKPSNILVKSDGEPKLLDFGIAKLLDPDSFPLSLSEATRSHFRPMTPAYASPEQLLGEPITTSTDVYTLGVLLYQLLTGELPHDGEDRLRQVLRHRSGEASLPKPSETLSAPAWESHDHRRVARQLRGDLDNIVAKALRPDPKDRYASVAELDEDLRRYLEGEPVRATRESPLYLVGKFLRRYRLPVAVATVIVILVSGFAVVSQRQAHHITQERDRANEIQGFLASMINAADSQSRRVGRLSLKELLDENYASLKKTPLRDPRAQSELFELIGDGYQNLDLTNLSADSYRSALTASQRVNEERSKLLIKLGAASTSNGQLEAASRYLDEAMIISAGDETKIVEIMNELTIAYLTQGKFTSAGHNLQQVLSHVARMDFGLTTELLATALLDRLTLLFMVSSDFSQIERAHNDFYRLLSNQDRIDSFNEWEVLNRSLFYQGKYPEALSSFRYLQTKTQSLHSFGFARTRIFEHLSEVLLELDRIKEAHRAVTISIETTGDLLALDPKSIRSIYQLAQAQVRSSEILESMGHPEEAANEAKKAIALLEPLERSNSVIFIRSTLAKAYLLAGDFENARPFIKQLLETGWRRMDFVRFVAKKGALPHPLPPPLALDLDLPPKLRSYIDSLPQIEPPWDTAADLPTIEEILAAEEARMAATDGN